jgi:hypothetical protein
MTTAENGHESKESIDGEIQINMVLKGKSKEMFEELKEYFNLGYNAELIRLLIKEVYRRKFKKG